jgi:hypothetical protein
MKLLEWVGEHPILTFFLLMVLCNFVLDLVGKLKG